MSFLRKLFGGDKKDERPAPPPPRAAPSPPPSASTPPASTTAVEGPDLDQADTRTLTRYLGSRDQELRQQAAVRLGQQQDRSAMRPLLNAYLNYGDPPAFEALRGYGLLLSPAVAQEANDMGLLGLRRARLMDVVALTGDPDLIRVPRADLVYPDTLVAVRAAVSLTRMGDLQGVDALASALQKPDAEHRTLALGGLAELKDVPAAQRAISDHLDRYLAEAGAVPQAIAISAPRLEKPDTGMLRYIAEHVDLHPHNLTLVIGSESVRLVASRRDEILEAMTGHRTFLSTPNLAPEEQIDTLRQARDAAEANADEKVVFFGRVPSPHDSPPLPHFLTRGTRAYTAKLILVDPHELNLAIDWYRYVIDNAEVPTDTEIILGVSRPGQTAISEEEYIIYQLVPPERREDFIRAYLAHL